MKRGEVPPVVLFLGCEAYERRRCREALLNAHLDETERESGLAQYDLSETSLANVIDDARAMSLFATRRLIIATSAEASLPRTGKAGSDDEDDDSGSAPGGAGFDALAAYVKSPTPGTVILFESTRFDWEGEEKKKNERIRKFFAAIPESVELRRYSPEEALGVLRALAKAAALTLAPGVPEMLAESLGGDAGRIATEIEKLALYANGRAVTEDDVSLMIPDARETTIFVLVSALGRRDRGRALGVLDTLCRDGEYLPLALSFLSGQFRMALVAKEANLRSAQQVQTYFQKAGVSMWGSKAEQVSQTAAKFSKEQLERGLKLIFTADRDLRSARPDDRVVMERFVVELTAA